jgi:hypothetical protein
VTARRWPAAVVLLAATVFTDEGPAGGQTCASPYSPVYAQRGYPFNDPAPMVEAGVVSTAPPDFSGMPPDFDGDGTSDVDPPPAIPGPLPATVHRPSGDITFVRAGSTVQVMAAGDLDGAPGQELWVMVLAGGPGPGGSIVAEAYVVPYATPAGTYDPADVGIRVEPGLAWPVPDRTGDGVPDVLDVDTGSANFVGGTTRVVSGAAVVAVAPGDDARPTSTVATIPGGAQAYADLGGPQPAIVTVQDLGGPELEVRVIDGATTTVFTNRPAVVGFSPFELRPGGVRVLAGPSGRFVMATADSRSGGGAYWWSLDDPCTPLWAATLPASRPASPVAGTPRYTG